MSSPDSRTTSVLDPTRGATSHRDWRIDVIRGIAMMWVLIDHARLGTAFERLTGPLFGFVSAAEVFVLVSGVVLGTVHRRRRDRDGGAGSAAALWRRARELYVAAVVMTFLVWAASLSSWSPVSSITMNPWDDRPTNRFAETGTLRLLLDAVTLRAVPWPIDVLGLYVLLCLLAPFATWMLRRPRGVVPLLVLSASAWGLSQVAGGLVLPLTSEAAFHVAAWQLLFVIGLSVGWHRRRLESVFSGSRSTWLVLLALALECAFLVVQRIDAGMGMLDRVALPPGRLLNVLAVVLLMYVALGLMGPMAPAARWLFAGLGANSLYVFLVHVPLLVLLRAAQLSMVSSRWTDLTLQVALIGTVWLMVRLRVAFRLVPR